MTSLALHSIFRLEEPTRGPWQHERWLVSRVMVRQVMAAVCTTSLATLFLDNLLLQALRVPVWAVATPFQFLFWALSRCSGTQSKAGLFLLCSPSLFFPGPVTEA